MKKLLISLVLIFGFITVPAVSYAQSNPLDEACAQRRASGDVPTACKEKGTENPVYGSGGIINNVANAVALVAGSIAIIYIILGGIKMITSTGDQQAFKQGRSTLIYAAVGIMLVVVARGVVAFVLSRLE